MNPIHLASHDSGLRLVLSGDVTIEHARDLQATLAAAISGATPLAIDARAVSRVDAAILQLLLAAARVAARTEIVGASTAWTEAFQRLGFPDFAMLASSTPRS